ncbi:MAG: phosphoribosylanthranilate isomerase [Desulfarculaceae bacterium]|nr:phosphoribosylanthranilate isomerase [Desulfarculaceae bacterium]MCF8046959.1 phosphoribosylanthranilate isomerase [Desulfarculaceae bacterium]MCF8099686.1 phosphoribosylanthranilate isomerase [Desulfarculaceae bacterium]MCF8123146.1 phosphoribosylanthranilate isomerase [Desulfarculaceae bacterium]
MTPRIKICGITNLDDALAACRLGADALGFVLAPSSRQVSPEQARDIIAALPPLVNTVGVFVDAPLVEVSELRRYCGLDWVQLHGDEDEDYAAALGRRVIKALRVSPERLPDAAVYSSCSLLLDTYHPQAVGGTGQSFDWGLACGVSRQRPVILAGGLTPDNVGRAIKQVQPFAVDVSSGVEKEKGVKDHERIANFIAQVRRV